MFSIVMASLVFLFLLNIPVLLILGVNVEKTPASQLGFFSRFAFLASLAVCVLLGSGLISGGVYIVCAALARVVG